MQEIPKRLSPTVQDRQKLFALSGNICAFPGCNAVIINDHNELVGQMCHIESALPGGERFNINQTNNERRSYYNLMLLCYPHHITTNDVHSYTVEKLKQMKAAHEGKARSNANSAQLDSFINQSLWQDFTLPKNVGAIGLPQDTITDVTESAPKLLEAIARLPFSTRQVYANVFLISIVSENDVWLCTMLEEMLIRFNTNLETLLPHIGILVREGLLVHWDESESDWRFGGIAESKYYFSGLGNDNASFLLWTIRRSYMHNPALVLDLFVNLNYQLLESSDPQFI